MKKKGDRKFAKFRSKSKEYFFFFFLIENIHPRGESNSRMVNL